MTELPPLSPLPEPQGDDAELLASLYLDGEATAEQRAVVEADPLIMATVEVFRSMAIDMAAVTPPPGLALGQISAALSAFDTNPAFDTDAPSPTVTSLSDRRRRSVGLPSWLGAAAVAALVVGGIGFAATRDSSDDAATDTAAPSLSASATNAEAEDDAVSDDAALSTEMVEEEMAEDMADGGSDTQADGDVSADFEEPAAEEAGQAPADRAAEAAAAAAFYEENGPFALADLQADTAAGFLEQLVGAPLLPIEESPCAASPVVDRSRRGGQLHPRRLRGRAVLPDRPGRRTGNRPDHRPDLRDRTHLIEPIAQFDAWSGQKDD